MTHAAAVERDLLCATAMQAGAHAPTLCGVWTVRDLVIHLLVRESGPAALGIAVPPLARLTDRATAKRASDDFVELVRQLRNGPPKRWVFGLPKVDELMNLVEFFVHHEDIRRAGDQWSARPLADSTQDALWNRLRVIRRALLGRSPVGVDLVRAGSDTEPSRLSGRPSVEGQQSVTVTGPPSELVLFAFGRQRQADVDLAGDPDDVERLMTARLGL